MLYGPRLPLIVELSLLAAATLAFAKSPASGRHTAIFMGVNGFSTESGQRKLGYAENDAVKLAAEPLTGACTESMIGRPPARPNANDPTALRLRREAPPGGDPRHTGAHYP
jgi:hypothetical protein